jgi:dCMP deaminase
MEDADPRPTFEQILMKMAGLILGRSTCKRLQVGCVISSVDFRKILSMGYNGNATGLPNTCDSEEPGKCGCLHAEENAVINCDSPRQWEKIVFCTHLPCKMCAKRLINLGGVQCVYYAQDYRLREGEELLFASRIRCLQLETNW